LVKIHKKSVLLSVFSVGALAETALWILPEGLVCAVGAKSNVPFAGRHKIELKKMCGGENKKFRRDGKECWLSCCPVEIWYVCWSPVKISVSFYVYSRPFGRCSVVC